MGCFRARAFWCDGKAYSIAERVASLRHSTVASNLLNSCFNLGESESSIMACISTGHRMANVQDDRWCLTIQNAVCCRSRAQLSRESSPQECSASQCVRSRPLDSGHVPFEADIVWNRMTKGCYLGLNHRSDSIWNSDLTAAEPLTVRTRQRMANAQRESYPIICCGTKNDRNDVAKHGSLCSFHSANAGLNQTKQPNAACGKDRPRRGFQLKVSANFSTGRNAPLSNRAVQSVQEFL
eukprot:3883331-Rhodomonas_salina.3